MNATVSASAARSWRACCPALADDVPPLETGPAEVTSHLISGKLEIRDARNGLGIVVPTAPILSGFPDTVQTSIDMHSQPTGVDLVITAHNTSNAAATLGHISAGIIKLGNDIESFDFNATSDPLHLNMFTFHAPAYNYPNDMYSPVFVLRNSSYAVGVSLQYPMLEYKHDVVTSLNNPHDISPGAGPITPEDGFGWYAMFWLGNPIAPITARWATLAPGETRTYVMSVRVTRNPQEWQTTLLPYRDYFRAHYGGVKYTRDTTPIVGTQLADESLVSSANPFGFGTQQRPDLNGWGPTKATLLSQYPTWPTIMLASPSGLYQHHSERNYPYQFTTHWNATPRLAEVYNTTNGLPSLVAAGKQLGLWWGRSCEVSTEWDTANYELFDPDNPAHAQASLAEMDGAARAGATLVGLDTFMTSLTPVWKQYAWIQLLEQRYPNIKFCTETSSCDIMHTLAPTFVPGWCRAFSSRPASIDDLIIIRHANYLCDFINPGHETWGQLSYQEQRGCGLALSQPMPSFKRKSQTSRPMATAPSSTPSRPIPRACTRPRHGRPASHLRSVTMTHRTLLTFAAGRLPGVGAGASKSSAARVSAAPPTPPPTPPASDPPPVVPPPPSSPSGSGSGSGGGMAYRPQGIFHAWATGRGLPPSFRAELRELAGGEVPHAPAADQEGHEAPGHHSPLHRQGS